MEPTVEPAEVTGVKLDSTFAGAGELKLYISVSPASLTSGNYWEGSVKDVITQEELDAFTTKITLNGKTLQQYMSEGFIKYIPSNNPGQLDVVFDNAKGGEFLTFGDEIIVFEKGCKFPGAGGALEKDVTYKFSFVQGGVADGTLEGEKEPENPPEDPDDKPTSDKFEEGTITWAGVHHYDSKNYIVHLNVSLKTLVAGQKYYDNGEIVNMSENQFWQFADYIFFNGYSFKDLIEMDPEIFITIQASEGRTDNIEFTVSPEALERNDIPYYGTTGKGETIDLRAGCLLPNKTEIKTNIAWNVTPGQPQGTQTTPSNITKKPVRYYDGSTDESPAICDKFAKLDTRIKVIHKKNGGLSDARNAGLDIASGDFIGFVDSDDWIENDMYETLYNLLNKYQADISACAHYIEYGTKTKAVFESKEIITFNHKDAMMALIKDKIIRNYVWEKLYKRELFNNLRFPVGKSFEDAALSYKIFYRANKTVLIQAPKYHYRIRSGSLTNTTFNPIKEFQLVQALHDQYQFVKQQQAISEKPLKLLKKAFHLINHIIIMRPSPLNDQIIAATMEICHHYDYLSLKDIGLSKAIRRYCIYNHFKLYTIGMIMYRKIVQKRRNR